MASTLTKIRFTPMRDIIRGRVTGRLDWRSIIASATLPVEIRSLITDVVTRSRLRRMERADVAQELVSHFTEATAAEVSPAESIQSFGDIPTAAKLIRRAKIRNRSWAWHFLRWVRYAVGGLVLCYGGLAIFYFNGKATPRIDYVDKMNAAMRQVPQNQRAWPIYRDAFIVIQKSDFNNIFAHSIDGPHWPTMAAWETKQQTTLSEIRRATALPAMGLDLRSTIAPSDANRFALPPRVDSLLESWLPQLNKMRSLALLLSADAKLAGEHHDGFRCGEDITALANLAEQQHREAHLLVGNLVAIGLTSVAYDRLDRTLSATPDAFTDQQLIDLAHRISPPQTAADLLSFRGEQMLFRDMVQRAFTDDGHGDGRIASGGFLQLFPKATMSNGTPASESIMTTFVEPAMLLAGVSRREIIADDDRIMDQLESDLHLPLRDVDFGREAQLAISTQNKMERLLISILVASLTRAQWSAERLLGQRDGLLVGIALEIYRRHHGGYPAMLQQLVSNLLPQIPADRITGEPLKYRLVDGKPLVYSVGTDRKDDGGRVPVIRGKTQESAAAEWRSSKTAADGDWVLYPEPRPPVEDDDE